MIAIQASDFSQSTTDTLRHEWTDYKMSCLIEAAFGQQVIVITDRQSGHAEQGELVSVIAAFPGRYARVAIRFTLSDGKTQTTNFNLFSLGETIIVLENHGKAKWDALQLHRKLQSAAITLARREERMEGLDKGVFKADFFGSQCQVSYTPREQKFGSEATRADRFTYVSIRRSDVVSYMDAVDAAR